MNKKLVTKMAAGLAAIMLTTVIAGCGAKAVEDGAKPADTAKSADSAKAGAAASTPAPAANTPAPAAGVPAAPAGGEAKDEGQSKGLDILQSNGAAKPDAIDWDKIHLTKKDFKAYIDALNDNKGDEKQPLKSATMPDDKTIEIVIDTANGGQLGAGLMMMIFDPFIRQMYVHSDYFKNNQQPVIRFKDTKGEVLGENNDFPKEKGK